MEHPECMKRLRDEIVTVYPDPHVKVTNDAVQSLPYLTAVIHEALRLRAILPFGMSRIVPKGGITLGDHFLPAGVSSIKLTTAISRYQLIYHECLSISSLLFFYIRLPYLHH
jgi:cytochrome P450